MGNINTPEVIKKYYADFAKLNEGGFGKVVKASNKSTGKVYILFDFINYRVVIKEVRNAFAKWDLALYALREISILHRMEHPNIPKLMYLY